MLEELIKSYQKDFLTNSKRSIVHFILDDWKLTFSK